MCSLSTFPPPPLEGYVTVCERNAELVATPKGESDIIATLGYPDINISQDLLRPSMSRETARSAFLEHEDTPRKRLMRAWYEHGLTGVLEELASNTTAKDAGTMSNLSKTVLGLVRWATSLHGSIFPHLAMSCEDLIAEFSQNGSWRDCYIRCFEWHPHTTKLAVALRDDSIKVYDSKRADITPVLKHKVQKSVACIAWKPMSASLLAVGCQTGVLVWNVDPTSLSTRPSSSAVQVLSQPGHAPVTSVSWCPQGDVLVSASPADSAIMVWDVYTEACIPLRRMGGGGVSLLAWSPDGSKLFAACPSSVFRVWETKTWTCEKWSKLSGRCQAACWSPQGDKLLFSTSEEACVYSLSFYPTADSSPIGGSRVAVACLDLTMVELQAEEGPVTVGGRVQNMVWDPTGERLAVHFSEGSPELIAVFQTRLDPVLELIPCGFIRGQIGEIPHLMMFQPKFDQGALLTVVWSSGRISYCPLYFIKRDTVGQQRLYQQQLINGSAHRSGLFSEQDLQ